MFSSTSRMGVGVVITSHTSDFSLLAASYLIRPRRPKLPKHSPLEVQSPLLGMKDWTISSQRSIAFQLFSGSSREGQNAGCSGGGGHQDHGCLVFFCDIPSCGPSNSAQTLVHRAETSSSYFFCYLVPVWIRDKLCINYI
jgi:hypothetical protein